MPVHLASNTGGTWLTTFSIAKSRKPINNLSTGPSLLFFGRKIKAALVGIPALLGMPIFLSRRYAPVFEVEPAMPTLLPASSEMLSPRRVDATCVTEELPLAFAEELKPSVPVEDFFSL